MARHFATVYDYIMNPFETLIVGRMRRQLLKQAKGEVLEIGSGTGINFPLYDPNAVASITAIEPNPFMIEKSKDRIKQDRVTIPISILQAKAERLPFKDNSFDCAVITLVLCSVIDAEQVLREIQRVCKPGGNILFVEHVQPANPILRVIAKMATPLWKRICDGCHLNRETVKSIQENGLDISEFSQHAMGIFVRLTGVNRK
ncbi:class I SAM-dependent methyltransferase [Peribacillus sp. SCS-155]|uniref:class I SAM-dependent methyltransferase n=1 Tax=Peribacillus sedimenti TaxID=3115297 RepID=UPI003905D016